MNIIKWIVTNGCKFGLRVLCRVHSEEMKKIQPSGPLILYSNHTGSIEAPIFYGELAPRPVTGLAKVESWDNWLINRVFTIWNLIPIRRGESDMDAMRAALGALEQNNILGIAPEGTRNRTGGLLRAKPGIVMIATRSDAPLQAIAHWGGENFRDNLKRFKRTDFHIRVGPVFHLDARGARITKEIRQQMVDEMMYQLAKLLPPEYRGEYADLENATEEYLRFVTN